MIIFIESNTSGTGEYFYNLCKKKKIKFLFLVSSKKKYPWLSKKYYKIIDTKNFNKLIKKIQLIKRNNNIKYILSTSDMFIETSNSLNKIFNLDHENERLIKTFKNKYECLKNMRKLGIVNRNFQKISSKSLINKINFPLIIKPINGTGSIDVFKINNRKQLLNKKNYLTKKYKEIILDEFIKGQEYSLEVFFYKKKIVFNQLIKKEIFDKKHFVESGHIISNNFDSKIIKLKNKLLIKLDKFKLNNMFLHIEFKIDDKNRIQLIEINPRLAGGFIPILIKLVHKIDLISLYLDLIIGKKFKKINKIKNLFIYKIIFLIPGFSQKIEKIIISNKISNLILHKKIYYDKLKQFKAYSYNFSDRLGHIIFKGKNFNELLLNEKKLKSNIFFKKKI